jgi:tetratricopeptide (TPR) repeat protein
MRTVIIRIVIILSPLFCLQLSAQELPNGALAQKYPMGTSLNEDNLAQYGQDLKEMMQAEKLQEAINHVERFFLPQIASLEEQHPRHLLKPLVWANFLFSNSKSYSPQSVRLGELYLSIERQHPDWSIPEDKFQVLWRTAIAYRSLSETVKCQNLIENGFSLLDNNDLPDEGGLRGDLFASLATLKINNRQLLEAKALLDSAKLYCTSPDIRCYESYVMNMARYYERINQKQKAANLIIKLIEDIDNAPSYYNSIDKFNVIERLAHVYYYDGQYKKNNRVVPESLKDTWNKKTTEIQCPF